MFAPKNVLVSLFYKDPYLPLLKTLAQYPITFYSTGGTATYLREHQFNVQEIEHLTGYPSILGGRVKTLHPKVFGGILARAEESSDIAEMAQFNIPYFDLVLVDLYPFEETLKKTTLEEDIIEKIDIGGISLIRAAAKNFERTTIIACPEDAQELQQSLQEKAEITLAMRRKYAQRAFAISSGYDNAIFNWFSKEEPAAMVNPIHQKTLRYGENPHQKAVFWGDLSENFAQLQGKELSYNNLLDLDHALNLILEFTAPTCAIIKHNNPCGLATRPTAKEAWDAALACDPLSAFGGVIVLNQTVDIATAEAMNNLFFEVLLAPAYEHEALNILMSKKNRILLAQKNSYKQKTTFRSVLNGVLIQDANQGLFQDWKVVTQKGVSAALQADIEFGLISVKHLKSNAIAIVKNQQLIGAGLGQTSRVDALRQALHKLKVMNFNTQDAILVSDAFFPCADSVELAHQAGIEIIVQPGGSLRDQESIDYCNQHNLSMIFTSMRHFKH